MKRRLIVAIAASFLIAEVQARLGETPEQLEQRYGAPIKQAFSTERDGVCVYYSKEFKEIRVHFANGESEQEDYIYLGDPPSSDPALVESIRAENPNQRIEDRRDRVRVYSERVFQREVDHLGSQPNGREQTYSGVVKIRSDEHAKWAVLTDRGTVVELPMQIQGYPSEFTLTSGCTYSVTLLQQWAEDINTAIGVVSKREHVDWSDCVDDAGVNGIEQLVRITEGEKVIFDRSVCGLHQVKMELRNVEMVYGMYAPQSKGEAYCMKHFPHFRDFALGGCLVGDTKLMSIYICPKCVAECDGYKRQHGEETRTH